jgi:hypothetical protein
VENTRLLLHFGGFAVLSIFTSSADYCCQYAAPAAGSNIQIPVILHTSKYYSNDYMTCMLLKNETNYKPLVSQSLFYILEH